MAHANPEFALAQRAYRDPPLRHATDTPPPATLGQLRARMRDIGRLIALDYPVEPEEREAYRLWQQVARIDRRQAAAARDIAATVHGRGMHAGGKAGERFVEPQRRYPADVQADRVRLDCRGCPA